MSRRGVCFVLLVVAILVAGGAIYRSSLAKTSNPGGRVAALLVDDFEDGDLASSLGGTWIPVTDKSRGGTSVATMTLAGEGAAATKRSLQVTGKVTTDFKFGYAGLGLKLNQQRDMSGYSGIRFYARGDGGEYRVTVLSATIKGGDQYGRNFVASKAWTLVKVPFSSLTQLGFGSKGEWSIKGITGFGFLTVRQPLESYSLRIDQLTFY